MKIRKIVAALIFEHGELLMLRRRLNPRDSNWSLPGGVVESDENLEEALEKRIKEELGLDVEALFNVGILRLKNRKRNSIDEINLFFTKSNSGQIIKNEKVLEISWFNKKEMNYHEIIPGLKEILEKLRRK